MKTDILLLDSLKKFYKDEENGEKLTSILIDGKSVSLRSIDWFITNYSKKHNICYLLYETSANKYSFSKKNNKFHMGLNVYHSYKSQLKSYSKKKFDPFCRRERIRFKYNGEKVLETTIGQLNFFKWAIDNLIIDYIKMNYKDIEIDIKEPEENLDEIKEEISDNNEEEKIPDNLDDKKIELSKSKFSNPHPSKGVGSSVSELISQRAVEF